MLVSRLNIQINKFDSRNARFVRFLDWKGLHLISLIYLLINQLKLVLKKESQTYYYILFFTDYFSKWPKTNSLLLRNCGFLSWDRIYFQGCNWSIQFTIYIFIYIYIPALSLEKTMYGYLKREKKSGLRTKIKSFHCGYSD